jgi:enterochelin esterase-like enzyme
MKIKIIILLFVFVLLLGCTPTPEYVTLEADCSASGTVSSLVIADTGRGYPYNFMLYLPPCYDAAAEPGYPIIYLVPGRGGSAADWFNVGVNEIADQLILAGEVPPFVLVTTETTNNDPYAADIYDDLIPHIESNYNTLMDRSHRAVSGGSLGGIAAYRLTFQYPEAFASAGMFGCGVINGENEQVADWLAAATDENRPRVFINAGEQDPLMLEQAEVMTTILDQAGVTYEFIVGEGGHTYDYWATNMLAYFRWVAEDW